jgi:hypothetical protein
MATKVADRHTESIQLSSFLSKLPRLGWEKKEDVVRLGPEDVIPVLHAAGVDFVLAGAHGMAGWLAEPRATQDVDFLIQSRQRKKACEAILKKYPEMTIEEHPVVWRFLSGGERVIDLMFADTAFFKRVFKEFVVKRDGALKFKIPKLESAIAMKFAAMIGPFRNKRKSKQDLVDVMSMLEARKKPDMKLIRELGELVYEGGGNELVKIVTDVREGRDVEL